MASAPTTSTRGAVTSLWKASVAAEAESQCNLDAIAVNWTASTIEPPGGTAGDGGGDKGGGGDGGGDFMTHSCWSGWHVGGSPGVKMYAGLHRFSPSWRWTHTPSSRVSELAPLT